MAPAFSSKHVVRDSNGKMLMIVDMYDAACNGDLSKVAFMHQKGLFWDHTVATAAAANGHLDVLKYVHQHGCPWDFSTTRHAAINGHLDCLRYAIAHGCAVDTQMILGMRGVSSKIKEYLLDLS